MLLRIFFAMAALVLGPPLAFSQVTQTQPLAWNQYGYTTLSASNSSTNVALPGRPSGGGFQPGSLVNICNTSTTVDAFAKVGPNCSVTASTSTGATQSTRIPF